MIILVFSIVTIVYLIVIGRLIAGFEKVEKFHLEEIKETTSFSIIIPFRNEAENLTVLLESLSQLDYPKLMIEVLFVDDESTDTSVMVIEHFKKTHAFEYSILKNNRKSHSPKKDAINTAIVQAKHPWIITTDADCKLPKYWLSSFDGFIQKNKSVLVAGPVTYFNKPSFFHKFQTLDFLSLIGTTIGSFGMKKPFMCNGANLAYKKSLFKSLNGFENHDHLASGDDVFLLQQAGEKYPDEVHFLKSEHALVETQPTANFKALKNQRIRWASKTGHYGSAFGKGLALLVFAANMVMVTGIFLSIFGLIPLVTFIKLFFLKSAIDFFFLYKMTRFTSQEHLLKSFVFSTLIYPFYCSAMAIFSLRKQYVWKDRTFKN
ncbi:glycosyltransferase [Mangrovimonas sp. AS39]|uniref:glycosyltransferase family 2 protein n=1 Tax=Mangrovimonas futianensis TaxID=2895523 RepID=UPI001E5B16A5|nr:glycosyltransferase [Mangrovimonas futianensis]MCF1190966.1 glycosyltransferase [Mangrovimonas futianensis]MCF1194662.1 glycosyltransferase [Mangrovimonas futianensis]